MAVMPQPQKIEEEVLKDSLAVSVARALNSANKKAGEYEVDIRQSLISITQEVQENKDMLWRIHYGSKDYIRRRGGDLIVYIDSRDYTIRSIRRRYTKLPAS